MIKSSTTITLVSIAAVLAIFVLGFERRIESSRQAKVSSRILATVPVEELKRIKVTNQMGEISIDRKDGGWKLMKPIGDYADPGLVAKLADKLAHLTIRETIDRDEIGGDKIRLSRFGLSKSAFIEVKMEFEGKREPVTFHFGANGPLLGTIYAKIPDSSNRKDVYVVDGDFRSWITDPGDALRDRRLFREDPGKIEAYVLTTEKGEMALKREPDAPRWYVERPIKARANDDIAYSILNELSQLQVDEFLDEQVGSASGVGSGGDPDTAVFKLKPQGGKPFTVRLRELGSEGEQRTMLAEVDGRDAVFRINNNLVSRLPKNTSQIRYPYLADLDPTTLARIQIESPLDSVDIRRLKDGGKEWHLIKGGVSQRANQDKIEQLLTALNTETIVEYRSDTVPNLEEYGLDRPFLQIAFTSSTVDGDALDRYRNELAKAEQTGKSKEEIERPKVEIKTRTIRFGRKGDILLNAKFDDEPYVYAIDPAFLSIYVPTHPIAWRGLELLGFELLSLQAIEMAEAGNPELKLFFNYMHGKWSGLLGDQRVDDLIDRRLAERLAIHLSQLKGRQWLSGSRQDAYRALRNPSLQLRIKLQKPSIGTQKPNPVGVASLAFAPATISGDRVTNYFGQFEGYPDVFVLSGEDYDKIVVPVFKRSE
tara:strand:- start:24920 stop:26875 length:1956 start_codon:yes stop_codon:yes gene_type:complete